MDITAYWLNHKRRDAGEGKVYYLYPYTRCEADDTPTLFIGGKHYIRIAVSEEEWTRLRKLDEGEFLNCVFMPVKKVAEMIESGQINDSKTICAVLLYMKKNK